MDHVRPENRCLTSDRVRTRRGFLQAAAVAVAAPAIVPASVLGASAPSNRLQLGLIGCGHQSQRVVPAILVHPDVRIVAVCDVNRQGTGYYFPDQKLGRETVRHWAASGGIWRWFEDQRVLDRTKGVAWMQENFGEKPATVGPPVDAYNDFRELIARKDVDAVVIIVPDHWHALMAVAAMKAGKDVYCEKPLSLTLYEGQQMIQATRQYGRVFQTGSQFRSCPGVRRACELVRNGRLGRIQRVRTQVDANSFAGPGPGWQPMPVPEGFDYDFWLGPAPLAPYHQQRCFHRWRYILDYSNGQTTNFGAHSNDIVQWALGTDSTGPVEFEDQGSEWPPAGSLFTAATKTAFRARYSSGIELVCDTGKISGALFEGTDGTLEVTLGGRIKTTPVSLAGSQIGPHEIHLAASNPSRTKPVRWHVDADHVRSFLDAVKSRKDPVAPVEVGYRSAAICLLGNIAQRLKTKFRWDPVAQRSPDNEQVNGMLRRTMRGPWQL